MTRPRGSIEGEGLMWSATQVPFSRKHKKSKAPDPEKMVGQAARRDRGGLLVTVFATQSHVACRRRAAGGADWGRGDIRLHMGGARGEKLRRLLSAVVDNLGRAAYIFK